MIKDRKYLEIGIHEFYLLFLHCGFSWNRKYWDIFELGNIAELHANDSLIIGLVSLSAGINRLKQSKIRRTNLLNRFYKM